MIVIVVVIGVTAWPGTFRGNPQNLKGRTSKAKRSYQVAKLNSHLHGAIDHRPGPGPPVATRKASKCPIEGSPPGPCIGTSYVYSFSVSGTTTLIFPPFAHFSTCNRPAPIITEAFSVTLKTGLMLLHQRAPLRPANPATMSRKR